MVEDTIFTEVRLNTLEADQFEWAISACRNHFEWDLNKDKGFVDKMFEKRNSGWFIIKDEDVIEDMIYRLDIQLPDMIGSSRDEKRARKYINAGKRVVKKLESLKGGV